MKEYNKGKLTETLLCKKTLGNFMAGAVVPRE